MEIVLQSKNSLFQQKFHNKLSHFNRNVQLGSVVQRNDPIGPPQSDKKIRHRLHPKNSDSATCTSMLVGLEFDSRRGLTKTLQFGTVSFLPGARFAEQLQELSGMRNKLS